MKSIILCEGKTDLILHSYYLAKVCGWQSLELKENKAAKKRLKNKLSTMCTDFENQKYSWYFRGEDIMCIYAVGSKDLFEAGIRQIIELNTQTSAMKFEKIAIISDRDDENAEYDLIREINSVFCQNNIQFSQILQNKWNISEEYIDMGEPYRFLLLPIIIPFDETGTIETFLMNCRKELNENEKIIIENVNSFIDEIVKDEYVHNNYLLTRGLKPKAKLGVYFAVISPNKTFEEGNKMLLSIPWDKYKTYHQMLELLNGI